MALSVSLLLKIAEGVSDIDSTRNTESGIIFSIRADYGLTLVGYVRGWLTEFFKLNLLPHVRSVVTKKLKHAFDAFLRKPVNCLNVYVNLLLQHILNQFYDLIILVCALASTVCVFL